MRPGNAVLSPLGLALAVAWTCAGCQPVDSTGAQDTDEAGQESATPLPSIHAVLTWETLGAGKNQARVDYQARLDACSGAGFATTPLDPADVQRLDTGRVEITIDAGRQAVRQTRWTLAAADPDAAVEETCDFAVEEDVQEARADEADGLYLAAGDPAEVAMAAKAGGWTELGAGNVGGQPCRRWRRTGGQFGPDEEVCIWSGGVPWGFTGEPVLMVACSVLPTSTYLTSIPLEAKALQGEGCNVQVEAISVGKARPPALGGRS